MIVFPPSPCWWKDLGVCITESVFISSDFAYEVRLWNDLQSVNSARSVLHAEVNARVLSPP